MPLHTGLSLVEDHSNRRWAVLANPATVVGRRSARGEGFSLAMVSFPGVRSIVYPSADGCTFSRH